MAEGESARVRLAKFEAEVFDAGDKFISKVLLKWGPEDQTQEFNIVHLAYYVGFCFGVCIPSHFVASEDELYSGLHFAHSMLKGMYDGYFGALGAKVKDESGDGDGEWN